MNVQLVLKQRGLKVQPLALLDSGAYSCFMHYRFVQEHNLATRPLTRQVRVFNADATENKKGLITHYTRCQVQIGNHTSWQSFLVAEIGHHDAIIGMTYLREHNPEIDWKSGTLKLSCCPGCGKYKDKARIEFLNLCLKHVPQAQEQRKQQQQQCRYAAPRPQILAPSLGPECR